MPELTIRRRRTRDDDTGLTLVELVITVSIIGVVTVALTGIMLAYFRNTADTQARLTESHDVQFASAYWQRDVSSIGVREKDPNPTTGEFGMKQSVYVGAAQACGNLPVGATPIGTLAWSDYSTVPNSSTEEPLTVRVTYAWRGPADGVYELLRVRCELEPSVIQVADSLVAQPLMDCVPACSGLPRIVTLALRISDPQGDHNDTEYAVTLTGERRQT